MLRAIVGRKTARGKRLGEGPVNQKDKPIVGVIKGDPAGNGTAFEIAGKGIANPGPMEEAIKFVAQSSPISRGPKEGDDFDRKI